MYIICLHILFWSYFHHCEAMTLCSIKLLEIGCNLKGLDVTWLKTAFQSSIFRLGPVDPRPKHGVSFHRE